MSAPLKSPPAFAVVVVAYLRHYRALGLRYRGVEHILSLLARYLSARGASDLDVSHYEHWCQSRAHLHPNTRRKGEQIVRRFCLYRSRSNLDVFVPSADSFCRLRPYVRPVIVEPEQIVRMLKEADQLPPARHSPLLPAVSRVATVLLYTSGLRAGELRRLRVEDVEDNGAVLRIRESKFHKSRLVPLSESTQKEVRRYLKQRAKFAVASPQVGPFICHRHGGGIRAYSEPGFQSLITRVFEAAKVRDTEGRAPRIHDLRHSFAVQSLIRSYRNAGDPQACLPKLALYLGHVSVESTVHYLKLVPAVAALANQRFEAAFGRRILGGES
jgi:integrase/recombinase XerD